MRKSLRIASMVLAALLFFSYDSLKAQVKIGGNPALIDPNAILELESTKKGFLLPRVDAAGLALISGSLKDGYLVYYVGTAAPGDEAGLFVKENGTMKRISTDGGVGSPWKLSGNIGDGNSKLGTTNAFPLKLQADNNIGITIGTDGRLKFGFVDPAAATENDVLIIDGNGNVKKKTMGTGVTSLNTITGDIELTLDGSTLATNAAVISTPGVPGVTPSDLKITYPILNGQAASYGFLKMSDYTKLMDLSATDGLKVIAPSTDVTGLAEGGVFAKAGNKWQLKLAAATETNPGIVSTGAQTFAGDKKFSSANVLFDVDNFRIEKTAGAAKLYVQGGVELAGITAQTLVNTENYNVLLQPTTGTPADLLAVRKVSIPGWKLTGKGIGTISATGSPVKAEGDATGNLVFDTTSTGTNFAISTVADKITFTLPDASTTANSRGLVTAAAQSFAGDKSFQGKVLVGPAATPVPTSNLNVNGSIGVKFRTIPTGSTIAADDHILLVAATSATSDLTLPDAATCGGRIYVIKRIPGAVPASEETNNVVIKTTSGQTINGLPETSITVVYTTITLMSDGANWQLISSGF